MGKKKQSKKKAKKLNESKSKVKKNEIKVEYLLAKVDNAYKFVRTEIYNNYKEWLYNTSGIRDISNLILGRIKGKETVLFIGENGDKVDSSRLTPDGFKQLHNFCRDYIGVGNYKVYNGVELDKETGRERYIGTIMDFDVRKPIKKEI